MSRDEAIALLVSDTIERMLRLRQVFWLQKILESGFPGYAKWSDEDLQREIRERGLDGDESTEAMARYDAGDTADCFYDDELQSRLADCAGFNH